MSNRPSNRTAAGPAPIESVVPPSGGKALSGVRPPSRSPEVPPVPFDPPVPDVPAAFEVPPVPEMPPNIDAPPVPNVPPEPVTPPTVEAPPVPDVRPPEPPEPPAPAAPETLPSPFASGFGLSPPQPAIKVNNPNVPANPKYTLARLGWIMKLLRLAVETGNGLSHQTSSPGLAGRHNLPGRGESLIRGPYSRLFKTSRRKFAYSA